MSKPRLLVLSHVHPFPGKSGQQKRVLYTLWAARKLFHVTFATTVSPRHANEASAKLHEICDEVVLLPSRYLRNKATRVFHRALGELYGLYTGLKPSNYIIGRLEFSPSRVAPILAEQSFDCALFEYWHGANLAAIFQQRDVPCVLDMHDLLWRAHAAHINENSIRPSWWKKRKVERYRAREEEAWNHFGGVIAINREEQEYVQARVPEDTKVFHAPMGVDLSLWPYSWEPARPFRVAYYGGLGNRRNQQGALRCAKNIMPQIWRNFPEAQLWLVGSNPPESIRSLASDPRIKVTGYLEGVADVLRTMSCVICPWSGRYGFRSRLIEVMATGVPVVASPDAVFGTDLEVGKGMLFGQDDGALAAQSLRLLRDEAFACEQSNLARRQVESLFSFDNTYMELMHELHGWLRERRVREGEACSVLA